MDYVKGKRVICYGAGKMLDEMCLAMPELDKSCQKISIVDGDEKKRGLERHIFGKCFVINNKEYLKDFKDGVLLVTSGAIYEIINDLQSLITDEIPVFSFYLMRREKYEHDVITVLDEKEIIGKHNTEQIPRVIHYFWFGKNNIPNEYLKNIETWEKHCPDYKFVLWNEKNCDIAECDYAKEAYEKGRYGFVPDYFRLKRVYEYGGIYLDLDVELLKPLDELLYLEAYAGLEDNNHVAFGVGFGSRKNFPLLKEMYEVYEKISFVNPDGTLNTTASPNYQTDVLKHHGFESNGKMQIIDGMTILPMNYLTVQSPHTGRRYITKNSFSIHKYAASWFTEEQRANKLFAEKLLNTVEMI